MIIIFLILIIAILILTKIYLINPMYENFNSKVTFFNNVNIGNNLGQVSSKHILNNQIDEILLLPTYSITFTITTYRNDNNWRNIYHYGNNNGERMPAMWIFPRNPWRYHFRIRTNRNRNDGVDFNIPSQFKKYNKKMTVTTLVSGRKFVLWPYRKKINNGPYINIKHFVSFDDGKKVLAGEGNIKGDIHIMLKRKMWIKNPWYPRGGYIVNSLKIEDNNYIGKSIQKSFDIFQSIQDYNNKNMNIKSERINNCVSNEKESGNCIKRDIKNIDTCHRKGFTWLDSGNKAECIKLSDNIKCDTIDKSLDSIVNILDHNIDYNSIVKNLKNEPTLISEIFKLNPC